MINRVVLVGRITKDPVMRKTQSGTSVVSFTLAVNRRTKDKDQQADFIGCQTWNKTADFMAQYVKKGSLLGVEGRIQTRSYDNASGKKVYVTEVVAESVQFLESKKEKSEAYQPNDNTYESQMSDTSEFDATLDIASDDLPF